MKKQHVSCVPKSPYNFEILIEIMNEASLFSLFSRDAPREELCDKYGMVFINMAHF